RRPAFVPWRTEFLVAMGAGALGAFALIRGLTSQSAQGLLVGAALAAVLGYVAHTSWRNARRRWYGQHVERWAVEQVGRSLDRHGIAWEAGRFIPGLGDVDLLVRTR